MSNEQEIECFNAFCEWYGCNSVPVAERKVEGTYYDRITQMCWQAWRKSWARRFTTVSPTGDA